MSFRKNDTQQLTLNDPWFGLTERERKALEKSWAKVFADEIFPSIDEERFRVLYNDDPASRPNTPANVIVGALVIKEIFNLSDDEVVEDLLLDPRFQYALHTSSFKEQPLSDKSLSRFRRRCYDYESMYGVDLFHDCVKDLAEKTAKLMNIDGRIRRMDSLMVESNIRRLSRMELIYQCIAKFVTWLHENGHDDLILSMEHYYDPNDFNRVIYHSRGTEASRIIQVLLNDADKLFKKCAAQFTGVTEYDLFVRCLSEQTIVEDGTRRLRNKSDGTMTGSILQNPSDPDATYREKSGRKYRGYTANIEESVGKNGSVVTDYQFEQNIKSDSEMLRNHLSGMEAQEEKVTLIADGAYSGTANTELAASKNVELITTDLSGRDVPAAVGAFKLNEAGTRVLKCPAGHTPRSSNYIRQSDICTASFDREQCAHCPYQGQCKPKIFKRVAKITVSQKMIMRAKYSAWTRSDDFKNYSKLRNGVETIPSILKNVYEVNRMPVRGRIKCKFFFGGKVAALNFRKLLHFRKGLGNYAPNPLLS